MSDFGRAVFDTSTLVSAALRLGSVPHRALQQALLQAELCASESTLDELDKVLMRAKFDRYLPRDVRREFVDLVRLASTLFAVSDSQVANVQPPCRDPKDHPFLALAQVCEAKVLVSSDADLLILHPWQQVLIWTPAAFLEKLGA